MTKGRVNSLTDYQVLGRFAVTFGVAELSRLVEYASTTQFTLFHLARFCLYALHETDVLLFWETLDAWVQWATCRGIYLSDIPAKALKSPVPQAPAQPVNREPSSEPTGYTGLNDAFYGS